MVQDRAGSWLVWWGMVRSDCYLVIVGNLYKLESASVKLLKNCRMLSPKELLNYSKDYSKDRPPIALYNTLNNMLIVRI